MRINEFIAKMKEARLYGRKKIEKSLTGMGFVLTDTHELTAQVINGIMENGNISMDEFLSYMEDLFIYTDHEKLADVLANKADRIFNKLESALAGLALCDLSGIKMQSIKDKHHLAQADFAALIAIYLNKLS